MAEQSGKKINKLPSDGSLFEFDFGADDDQTKEVASEQIDEAEAVETEQTESVSEVAEETAVTEVGQEEVEQPNEAVESVTDEEVEAEAVAEQSAEEITEKFGFIKELGASFIDEGEQEADTPLEELIKEREMREAAEAAKAPVVEEIAQPEADVVEESAEQVAAADDEIEETVNEATEEAEPEVAAALEENTETVEDPEEIAEATEVTEVAEVTEEIQPEEPSVAPIFSEFDEKSAATVVEAAPGIEIEHRNEEFYESHIASENREGVQLTFLDTVDAPEKEETVDAVQEEAVNTPEPFGARELEPETAADEPTVAPDITVRNISASEEEVPEAEAEEAVVIEMPATDPAKDELTPIEEATIAEEQRKADEAAEAEQQTEVAYRTYDDDIWDESDKALWIAKKRYSDYCASLVVPPLKTTKETPAAKKSGEAPRSSGYRYEMTERLPVFADGLNGGKDTDSYFKREVEYCEEREAKRSKQLLDKLRSSWRKTLASLVIMLTVILLETVNQFMGSAPDKVLTASNTGVFAIIDVVLLLVAAAFVFDGIIDGIRFALKGVFIPETMTAGVVILSLAYHVVLIFAGGSNFAILFATPAVISTFLCALYRYNMLKREYVAFSVTSSYGAYLTEVKMLGFKNSPEGRAFNGYADPDAALYKLNRVSRIDACYTDKPVRDECYGMIRKLSLCTVCAAVVAGIVFGLINRSVLYGALSLLSIVSLAAPVSVFVAMFIPRIRTATVSAQSGGALVDFDDESDEFDESVIMIDDGELFPPDRLISTGFEMQRSERLEIHLARTYALFKKIGGTLGAIFNNMEGGLITCREIVITEVSDSGVAARIDGRLILAGSESFLNKYGVKVKRYDKLLQKNGRVMYIADDGIFFARAILTFKPDEELVKRISELRGTGTVFSLKTCNPCIDRELIFDTTGLEPDLLRLIKYEAGDEVAPAATDREGSLVSSNGACGLITALIEYKRQKKLVFRASRFACVACGIGAFVSLLTSAIGIGFGFSSLISVALHGILSLSALVIAKGK